MSLWIQIPVGVFLMAALGAGIWWVYFRRATYRKKDLAHDNPVSIAVSTSHDEEPAYASEEEDEAFTDPPHENTDSEFPKSDWQLIEVEYGDLVYTIQTKHTQEECETWLREYTPTAITCERCGSVIFPLTAVGRIRAYYVHLNGHCEDTSLDFVGYTDESGKLIPEFEGGVTLATHSFRVGEDGVGALAIRKEGADYIHVGLRPVEAAV